MSYQSDITYTAFDGMCSDTILDNITPSSPMITQRLDIIARTSVTDRLFVQWFTESQVDHTIEVMNPYGLRYNVYIPKKALLDRQVRSVVDDGMEYPRLRYIIDAICYKEVYELFGCVHVRSTIYDLLGEGQVFGERHNSVKEFEIKVFVFFRFGKCVSCCVAGPHRVFTGEQSPVGEWRSPDMARPCIVAQSQFFGHLQLVSSFAVMRQDAVTFSEIAMAFRSRMLDFIGCSQGILMGLGDLYSVYHRLPGVAVSAGRMYPFVMVGMQMYKHDNRKDVVDLENEKDEQRVVFPQWLTEYPAYVAGHVAITKEWMSKWAMSLSRGGYEPVYLTMWRVLTYGEIRDLIYKDGVRRCYNDGFDPAGESLSIARRFCLGEISYEAVYDTSIVRLNNNTMMDMNHAAVVRSLLGVQAHECPVVVQKVYVEFRDFGTREVNSS